MNKSEKREIAEKAFMLGVNWVLKVLAQHPDVWNVDDQDAKIIRTRAEKIIKTVGVQGGAQ